MTVDIDRPLVWFRFEASFATDPRFGMLSDAAQLAYVRAMCATATRVTPCTDERFAWWTRCTLATITTVKQELEAAGLVSAEWVPTDWDRAQPPVDRTNADRQKRHRERRRAAAPETTPESSNGVTNGTVTAAQDRTGEDRTGQDITDRTGEDRTDTVTPTTAAASPAAAAEPSANPSHSSIVKAGEFLPNPFPRKSSAKARRSCEDFDAILDCVAKLIGSGAVSVDDVDGLAKASRFSHSQVRVAVGQLRDRGRLP